MRTPDAAAATAVIVADGSTAFSTPITVSVDRPYLVTVVDRATGAVLFMGHVVDPTDAGDGGSP